MVLIMVLIEVFVNG